MAAISIILELNIGERVGHSCRCSVWIFTGDWNAYCDAPDEPWRQRATKILGPVLPETAEELYQKLGAYLATLGHEVLKYDTADD